MPVANAAPSDVTWIYLASASPRRRALLDQLGVSYVRLHVSVDERQRPNEDPEGYVARLAVAKARGGWDGLGARPNRPVLGADTAVVVDDMVLGKPHDRSEAITMLESMSGRAHRVFSAVALVAGARQAMRVQQSSVWFRALRREECADYWDTGEPKDKAGGYAIQGRAAVFISRLEGSYSGVMGLPLFETANLLRDFGVVNTWIPSGRTA